MDTSKQTDINTSRQISIIFVFGFKLLFSTAGPVIKNTPNQIILLTDTL